MTASGTIEEYGALRDMMIEIRTRLDVLIGQQAAGHSDHEARIRLVEHRADPGEALAEVTRRLLEQDTRVRAIERKLYLLAGAAMAGGGGLGAWLSQVFGG